MKNRVRFFLSGRLTVEFFFSALIVRTTFRQQFKAALFDCCGGGNSAAAIGGRTSIVFPEFWGGGGRTGFDGLILVRILTLLIFAIAFEESGKTLTTTHSNF
jgi:hypothetical protein